MNVSLYQAAAAMNAHSRWQEVIAENLATTSIPGARKQNLSFASVEAGLSSGAPGASASHFVIPSAITSINLQPGEVRSTGSPTDLAIDGKGFFEVQLPNGAKGYTRDGEFQLNGRGQLVTKQGSLVMSDSGPLQFNASNTAPISIAPSGQVSQGADIKGRLRIVDFENPRQLTVLGGGFYGADPANTPPKADSASSVRQGFLETSNTSPTTEMAELVTAMRMFESNQRVMQMQDERMGRVITELGNPS